MKFQVAGCISLNRGKRTNTKRGRVAIVARKAVI